VFSINHVNSTYEVLFHSVHNQSVQVAAANRQKQAANALFLPL
jgi:hypothetical protein